MSDWKPTPSTAFTVGPHTPVSECVRIMRKYGFGSLLISDYLQPVLGIFTERDVIRWIDEIQHGGHWDKPVALLMTKNVVTITIEELDQAASLMIEKNIRHLPVIHDDPTSGRSLVGIISMRDLLKRVVRQERAVVEMPTQRRAALISGSESIRSLVRKICAKQANIFVDSIESHSEAHLTPELLGGLTYLFLDLDGIASKDWIALLKRLNALENGPTTFRFFDTEKHTEAELELLSKLSLSARFMAYVKPLNIFTILNQIS